MNRTLLDEHFRVKGREKWYTAIEEIQADLDAFMLFYNTQRTYQGYRVQGRTPVQALKDATGKKKLPSLDFCTTSPQPSSTEQEEPSGANTIA
ncbi:integrase catalytic region [Hylemonella gracilis ATCC 19624]|uniref:Integrase catalytic region n=1 Tax=Hylemonella gracilis ATCC 19624 TaxID=887062 RepID=F3KXN6_9BURK|nr:integrase catalytic region [Hylemonella gracilis ATCC 19624]